MPTKILRPSISIEPKTHLQTSVNLKDSNGGTTTTTIITTNNTAMSVRSSPSLPLSLLFLALESSSDKLSSTRPRSKRASKGRVFQCTGYPDCNMLFTRSEHLARHKRKHTGERPFTCPHCSKNFSRLDNLRQHKQTVHAYETMIAVAHIPEIKNEQSSPELESAPPPPPPPPAGAAPAGRIGMSTSVSSAPASLSASSAEMVDLAPTLPPQLHRQPIHIPNTLGTILSPTNVNGLLYQQNDQSINTNQHGQLEEPLTLQDSQHNNQQQNLQQNHAPPNNNNPNHQIYQYHIQQPYYPQSQYVAPLHFYPHMSYGVPPPLPSAPLPATIPMFGNLASAPTAVVPTPTNHVLGSTSSTSDSSPASISSNANNNNNSNGITAAGSPPLPLSQSSETLKLPTSEFRPKRRPRPLELRYSFMASAPSLADTTKTPVTTSSALTTPTPSSMSSSLQVPSSVSTSHMHQDEVHGLKSAPPTSSFSAAYSRSSIISPLSPLFHQLFHQVKQQPASSLSVENKENIGSVAAAFGTPGTGTGVVLPPVATSFSPLHIPPIRSSKNWLNGVLNGTSSTANGNANPGNTVTDTTYKPVQSGDDDMVVDGTSQENGTIKDIEIKCEGVKHGEVHKEEGNNITKTNEDDNNTNSNNNNGSNNIDVDVDVDNVGTASTTTNRVIEKRQSIRNLLS